MTLPTTYFCRLAQGNILVKGGRVFQLKPGTGFRFKDKEYELSESETLADMEDLYKEEYAKEIDQYQTENVQKYVKSNVKNKSMTIKRLHGEIQENNALILIFSKIIPVLSGEKVLKNLDWEARIDEKERKELAKIDDYREFRDYMSMLKKCDAKSIMKNPDFHRTKDKSLVGRYILSGFDAAVIDKKIYKIDTEREMDMSLADVERKSQQLNQAQLLVDALKTLDERSEEMKKLTRMQAAISRIIERGEFEGKNGGFRRRGEKTYTFWLKFDAFINRHPKNGKYMKFPAGKVIADAEYKDYDFHPKRSSIGVEGRYTHPYTAYDSEDRRSALCIGDYELGKDNGWKELIELLKVGKRVLLSGYNVKHTNIDDNYGHHKNYRYDYISDAEAQKCGIPITNVNVGRGGK